MAAQNPGMSYKYGQSYAPYFYKAGHYLWTATDAKDTQKELYSQPAVSYGFSDFQPAFAYPQTVEQVIYQGYLAVPRAEPEFAIIHDKRDTSKLALDDVIRQVRRRYEIYEQNIYQIEQGKCYAISALFNMEARRGGIPADSKEYYQVTKQLQEFYQQQRDERVRLWQDVSRLRLALPETAHQYLASYRKMSILNNTRDDLF